MSGTLASIGLDGHAQTIPLGPVASQVAIKQLGTNGGGFYGVNSAHPLENPTAWSNLIEVGGDPGPAGRRCPSPSVALPATRARVGRCSWPC